jgi:hypothetical protein
VCYAVAYPGDVVDTIDGGVTWTLDNVRAFSPLGISCPDARNCLVFTWGDSVYVTADGGASWSQEWAGGSLYNVSCSLPTSCIGVGQYAHILLRATASGVTARPGFVAADGTSPSTITVTLRSALGEPLPGKTVSLVQSTGSALANITPASAVSDGGGQAVFSVTSNATGIDTFKATNTTDAVPIAQTAAVTFVANPFSATTMAQSWLRNSDGATWKDIDPANLSVRLTPTVDSMALIGGNIDLWTANAGYNQDVGISVSGGTGAGTTYPTVVGQPEAWKESGGFAGTYSPNAAFVQAVLPLKAGSTYTISLQWKTNKPAVGATIYAGAGPIGSDFSPSRLTAQLIPASSVNLQKRMTTAQPTLVGSDGSMWTDIDPSLSMGFTAPAGGGTAIIGGNADLWTMTAGYNQDIGISVVDTGLPPCTQGCQPVAWKESGGFAGTYSPNAAFVQTTYQMTAGHVYQVKLQWKANRSGPDATIVAGAGPVAGRYSPTLLRLLFVPSGTGVSEVVSTNQFSLIGSDGVNWRLVDFNGSLNLSIPAQATSCQALVSANADLWTQTAGYNQDLGIFVNGSLVAWKESGGIAGTYSPNAAFVQTVLPIAAATAYQVQLKWKTNRQTELGATIYNGAGPIGPAFSPTRLTVQLVSC